MASIIPVPQIVSARRIAWLCAALLALSAFFGVAQWAKARRHEKRVEAIESKIFQAEQASAAAQGRAAENARQALAIDARLSEVAIRAEAAQRALDATRKITVSVKGNYDQIRNSPIRTDPVDVRDVCAKLAALGIRCD